VRGTARRVSALLRPHTHCRMNLIDGRRFLRDFYAISTRFLRDFYAISTRFLRDSPSPMNPIVRSRAPSKMGQLSRSVSLDHRAVASPRCFARRRIRRRISSTLHVDPIAIGGWDGKIRLATRIAAIRNGGRSRTSALVVAFYATMKRSIIVRDYPSGPADAEDSFTSGGRL